MPLGCRSTFTCWPRSLTSVAAMAHRIQGASTCSGCGHDMHKRLRGPAQGHLPVEFVCQRFDCPEFGIYKLDPSNGLSPAAVPGTFLG